MSTLSRESWYAIPRGIVTCLSFHTANIAYSQALSNCYNGDSGSMGCVRKDGDKYFVTVKSDDITATGGSETCTW